MRYSQDQKQSKTKKNTYSFNLDHDRKIQISSNFDSGNISLIKQVTQLQYRLQCVPDAVNSTNKKCWFYFKVTAPKFIKLRFYLEGISIYQPMYQEENWGKPVYRIGDQGKWNTLQDSYLILRDQVSLMLDYHFQTTDSVYFAMSIPFGYWEMENYLHDLKFIVPESIQYKDEIIKETKTGKNLHMLTIQDKQLLAYKQQSKTGRCIILVTSRVHPGQVSGSFCLMGMLDFILRPFSLQSLILRKMFTFVFVPIVNPQGVYQGNYRMDLNGQNLNRVYLDPSPSKHQTVFAIKEKISEFLKKGDRIMFHFDLHSHSTMRRSFIYGNAFDDIILQTETEMFTKILDKNCQYFQESLSQFGQKHMKFKDKGESMSKQGCARVVLSKMASITYSYTVQSSIFPVSSKSSFQDNSNTSKNLNFEISDYSFDEFNDKQYSENPNIVDQNRNLGIKIMISILDLIQKNPFSPFEEKDLDEMRKQISYRILQSQERFKMLDTKAYHKSKFISNFARNQFENKFKDQWSWLTASKTFANVQWPLNFNWFKNIALNKVNKPIKLKTETRQSKIYTHTQIESTSLKGLPEAISNRLKISEQIQSLRSQFEHLPLIRKSLETKRFKTEEKYELSEKKITQIMRMQKNVLATNRSNILLAFLDEVEEKHEQKRLSKKRIISLKMASMNRYSAQKNGSNNPKINDDILDQIETNFNVLKPSHSQGQLSINSLQQYQKTNDQEGLQFEDKLFLKNIEIKKSRKQLLNKKVSMLRKINQTKKIASRNTLMKLPQIGKAFLITNARKKMQKQKTIIDEASNEQKSTIQSAKQIQKSLTDNKNAQKIKNIRAYTQVSLG